MYQICLKWNKSPSCWSGDASKFWTAVWSNEMKRKTQIFPRKTSWTQWRYKKMYQPTKNTSSKFSDEIYRKDVLKQQKYCGWICVRYLLFRQKVYFHNFNCFIVSFLESNATLSILKAPYPVNSIISSFPSSILSIWYQNRKWLLRNTVVQDLGRNM